MNVDVVCSETQDRRLFSNAAVPDENIAPAVFAAQKPIRRVKGKETIGNSFLLGVEAKLLDHDFFVLNDFEAQFLSGEFERLSLSDEIGSLESQLFAGDFMNYIKGYFNLQSAIQLDVA